MISQKLHFHFITLFPQVIQTWLDTSILGRAIQNGVFSYTTYQLRDFASGKHRNVDDLSYGGGGGMVLKVDCLVAALEWVQSRIAPESARVIYFSPAGTVLNQTLLKQYQKPSVPRHLIFICGHYEGVDQRFIDHWVHEEISLGDFVLTGGELPALAFTDALARQLEGTLGEEQRHQQESFSLTEGDKPILEYPQYTRPANFRGLEIPEVLLSGDHEKIASWRKEQSLLRTQKRRPDLLR